MSAPRGVWDGRTLWDRWSGVQVVDEEVLLGWATTGIVLAGNEGRSRRQRGVASNGVRTQPSGFTDYGLTSGTAAGDIDSDDSADDGAAFPAHLLNSTLDPSSAAAAVAEMYVPPVQYMGAASTSSSYPDPDDFDPISPPPMAPVRDSFFGGAYGAALNASAGVSPTGPEPVYYPFPPASGTATPSGQAGLIHSALDGLEQALRSAPVAAADGGPDNAETSFRG
ncbi:hypothetical protein BCR44DRAFT_218529 [Catenaria anguillulae PL171]|uniref:Uncharacterized protein n=1 Tax=Catenaria anguillulae PL171 TaxID=765915 RepID=A0A1Y2HSF6_9FUNG|nr:hypothetical protein BCR44DRAFT_218529 [Catenaria anguillulae PL171]